VLKAAPGTGTVDRVNGGLFDKGYRIVVQDGKHQVVRLVVKFNFRDVREYRPIQAIQVLDGVLSVKGYTVARRGSDLVVTKKDKSKYPPRLPAIDNNGAVVKTDASGDVVEVSAGSPAADELLRELSTLPKLRRLHVESTTRGTPAGLAHIAAMPALESLGLYSLGITDNDLRHIAKRTGLRELSLAENAITDVGLTRRM
jgi:hypothetical protein